MGKAYLTALDVARLLGVGRPTIRQYLAISRRKQKAGTLAVTDFPLPDALAGIVQESPLWKYETLREYAVNRSRSPIVLPDSAADAAELIRHRVSDGTVRR
ncbi:hypothetical protein ACMZ78_04560 [Gardnerella swidsinskii]|uniref:hypothetical protein n=1 Tax=Gardnerella swidsinskii TaxID=2792979 RepID=UPI0039F08161